MKGFQSKISVGLFIAICFVSLFPLDAQARRTHVWDSAEKNSPYITKNLDYSRKDFSQRSGQNALVLKELADIKKKQEKIIARLENLGEIEEHNIMPDSFKPGPWYISGNAGWSFFFDGNTGIEVGGSGYSGTGSIDSGLEGYFASASVGRSFGALRIDLELSYGNTSVDNLNVDTITVLATTVDTNAEVDVGANIETYSAMINGWYDFDLGSNWTPYIGVGIGASILNANIEDIAGLTVSFEESYTTLAYQAGVGVGYQLTPSTDISLSYRYYGSLESRFSNGSDNIDLSHETSNLMLGIMYRF